MPSEHGDLGSRGRPGQQQINRNNEEDAMENAVHPTTNVDPIIQGMLDEPLGRDLIHEPRPGQFGSYIEGHDAIDQANRIFGYDGWSFTVDRIDLRQALDRNGQVTGEFYVAHGILMALGQTHGDVGTNDVSYRRDDGYASPDSHETAFKGAATDCLKRCLRHLGRQFGNDLYDKDRDGVDEPPYEETTSVHAGRSAPAQGEPAPSDAWEDGPWEGEDSEMYSGPAECPEHHTPWRFGDWGPYCPSKGGEITNKRGWCDRKPKVASSASAAAAHLPLGHPAADPPDDLPFE